MKKPSVAIARPECVDAKREATPREATLRSLDIVGFFPLTSPVEIFIPNGVAGEEPRQCGVMVSYAEFDHPKIGGPRHPPSCSGLPPPLSGRRSLRIG